MTLTALIFSGSIEFSYNGSRGLLVQLYLILGSTTE